MVKIDYKKLRKINPETARTAVLEYLSSNGGNVADCARAFSLQRAVIYDIIKKGRLGDLKDQSRAPKKVANKIAVEIEKIVIDAFRKTGFTPKRLCDYLLEFYHLRIPYGTLRGILRRNKG